MDGAGDWAVGTWAAECSVINGSSSRRQTNSNAAVTGTVGSSPLGRLSMGTAADGASGPANCQLKEVIVFPVAHDAATIARVIGYLSAVGSL